MTARWEAGAEPAERVAWAGGLARWRCLAATKTNEKGWRLDQVYVYAVTKQRAERKARREATAILAGSPVYEHWKA